MKHNAMKSALCAMLLTAALPATSYSESKTSNKDNMKNKKTLVVFFSRTGENYAVGNIKKGNTHIIAEMIAEETNGALFQIEPSKDYPENYTECTEVAKKEVESLLKTSFRPEFLNRLDETVIFKPLQKGEIEKIVKLFISSLKDRLEEKRLTLEITDKACAYLAENGYDPVLGARPLKRYVQQAVETPLAKELLAGRFLPGDTVKIDAAASGITIANPKK